LSLTQYNIVYDALPRWNHFENFGRILRDGGLRGSLSLSVQFAVIATAAEVLIGLAVALFLDTDPPGRNLLLGIFLLPMIMAPVDAAAGWQLFRRITLPQIAGMIIVAAGLRVMDAFLELDKVFIMTGGGPGTSTQFISMFVYKQAFQFYELGYASAVITVVLAALALAYAMYLRGYGRALRPADSR